MPPQTHVKRRRSRGVPGIAGVLAAAIALAGCHASDQAGPPVIKLATWFGSTEAREMAPIIEAVNKRHTKDFQIQLVAIPGEYMTKVDTMLAGKVAPDLFLLSQEYVPSYAAIGAIKDLDAQIKADKMIDLPDYYPAGLATAQWGGKLFGLPIVMMPVMLYYNRTLFDQAHEPYPTRDWDWQTFRSAAKRLTIHNSDGTSKQWGFLQHTWPPFQIWVWQNGGTVLSADNKHPTLEDPATLQALNFMRDLVVTDKVSPGAGTVAQNGANELFKGGRIAMFMGGASDDLDRMPGLPVGVSELPHGKVRATFSYTADLVMSGQTAHPDQAYTAWREVLDGFHHWKIVPPRRSLARQMATLEPRKAAAAPAILASMEYARGIQGVVEQTDWDGFLQDRLLLPVLEGRESVESAAHRAQTKLNRVMETTP